VFWQLLIFTGAIIEVSVVMENKIIFHNIKIPHNHFRWLMILLLGIVELCFTSLESEAFPLLHEAQM